METINETYSVFYNTGENSYFQSKTDCPNMDIMKEFLNSKLFTKQGFTLEFVLKNGSELVIGKPKDDSKNYFKKAMLFAVNIPLEEYLSHL